MAKSRDAKGNPSGKQMPLELAPAKVARIFSFPQKNPTLNSREADALKRVLAHAENLGKKNS
jgi:hypothetical protein